MPKKKTGARKKKERQAGVQASIRAGKRLVLSKAPCNADMQCSACGRWQKNRAFCYFCDALQKMPMCAECGRNKCLSGTGDCAVPHTGRSASGWQLVGAVCDHCEAFVCHSKRCLSQHGCPECPLEGAKCMECTRGTWDTGGVFFQCGTCEGWLCGDDQFEHQASCTYLDAGTYQCSSCSRFGTWSCLRCKVCFCDAHRDGAVKTQAGADPVCKKCRGPLRVTKDHSVSTRTHKFGRKGGAAGAAGSTAAAAAADAATAAAAAAAAAADEDGEEEKSPGDVERLVTEFGDFTIKKYDGGSVDRNRFTFAGKRVAGAVDVAEEGGDEDEDEE